MRKEHSWLVAAFFDCVSPDHLHQVLSGAGSGREAVDRLLNDPVCLKGIERIVLRIYERFWAKKGHDGFISHEDCLSEAVLVLYQMAAPLLDTNRDSTQQIAHLLLWVYQRLKRMLVREATHLQFFLREGADPDSGRPVHPVDQLEEHYFEEVLPLKELREAVCRYAFQSE